MKTKFEKKMNQAKKQPCLICNKKAWAVCHFTPNDPVQYGARSGQARILFYTLCKECAKDPKIHEKVEMQLAFLYGKCKGLA